MGIYEKLLTIQQELKAPKGQYNSFGKYYYRSCEDILEAVKPLCIAQKAVLVLLDEITEIGGRVYVKATAKLIDTESSGSVTNTAFAREDESKKGMDGAQITGTASSYARKYALNGLFCIDDSKDADTNEYKEQQGQEKQEQHPTAQQVAELMALAKQKGVAVESIVNGYKLQKLEDISTVDWAKSMNALRKRADANG